MAWWRVLVVLAALDELTSGYIVNNTLEPPNGCVLLRSTAPIFALGSHDIRSPYLDCSYLHFTSFDTSDLPLGIGTINLAGNHFAVFDMDDMKAFTKLWQLDLRSNQIFRFSASAAPINSIKDAHLSNNELVRMPRSFLCSVPKLSSLDLSANKLTSITDDDFACLKNLTALSLASNPLMEVSDDAFKNLSNLTHLILSFTGLQEVPDFLISVPELVYLSLTNNKISNIPANAFSALPKLQWLLLSTNQIARIDSTALVGLTYLRYLDLTDNVIETLEEGVFDFEGDEEFSIEMYENPLRCDCSLKWIKLWTNSLYHSDVRYKCEQPRRVHGKKAHELTLSEFVCDSDEPNWSGACTTTAPMTLKTPNTSIHGVEGVSDHGCPHACSCSDAKGRKYYPKGSETSVPRKRFSGHWGPRDLFPQVDCSQANLPGLPLHIGNDVKSLVMRENLQETFYIADLKPYSSLLELDLEGCGLTSIEAYTTVKLPNLKILLLQRNKLSTFGRNHLASFPNLSVLNLSYNKFVTFPNNMFSNNRRLDHLYLGSNPVRDFNLNPFFGLNLRKLSLRDLGLDDIPVLDFENLTYFDVSDNYLTVIRSYTFIRTPSLLHLTMNRNKISKVEPAAFKGAFNLQDIDLSENKITTLPDGVFEDMSGDGLQIELRMNKMSCDCKLKWLKTWIERLEDRNLMTDIRFICFHPRRMHDKKSDHLTPGDFLCKADDGAADFAETEETTNKHCFSGSEMFIAIVGTFIGFCIVMHVAFKLYIGYLRYADKKAWQAKYDAEEKARLDKYAEYTARRAQVNQRGKAASEPNLRGKAASEPNLRETIERLWREHEEKLTVYQEEREDEEKLTVYQEEREDEENLTVYQEERQDEENLTVYQEEVTIDMHQPPPEAEAVEVKFGPGQQEEIGGDPHPALPGDEEAEVRSEAAQQEGRECLYPARQDAEMRIGSGQQDKDSD